MDATITTIIICIIIAAIVIIYSLCRKSILGRRLSNNDRKQSEHKREIRQQREGINNTSRQSEEIREDNTELRTELKDDNKQQQNSTAIIRKNNRSARDSNNRIKDILDGAKKLD